MLWWSANRVGETSGRGHVNSAAAGKSYRDSKPLRSHWYETQQYRQVEPATGEQQRGPSSSWSRIRILMIPTKMTRSSSCRSRRALARALLVPPSSVCVLMTPKRRGHHLPLTRGPSNNINGHRRRGVVVSLLPPSTQLPPSRDSSEKCRHLIRMVKLTRANTRKIHSLVPKKTVVRRRVERAAAIATRLESFRSYC